MTFYFLYNEMKYSDYRWTICDAADCGSCMSISQDDRVIVSGFFCKNRQCSYLAGSVSRFAHYLPHL